MPDDIDQATLAREAEVARRMDQRRAEQDQWLDEFEQWLEDGCP